MVTPISRSRAVLSVFAAIGVVLAVAAWLMLSHRPSNGLASEIKQRVAALHVNAGTVELTYRKALNVRDAIRTGDFTTADRIITVILTRSKIGNWRYSPFDEFLPDVLYTTGSRFGSRLTEWATKEPTNAKPLLLRAQYYYKIGWAKRGHNFAAKTEPARMTEFADYMAKALADVDAAIRLDAGNPYGFYLKLRILQSKGVSQDFASAFEEAVGKYPAYYPLYDIALATLQPRWGGTIPAMYNLVDKYAGNATESSPLKLLYLSLYRYLLGTASVDCAARGGDQEKTTQCVVSLMQRFVLPGLEQHVLAALQLYDHTDKYEFGLAIQKIVSYMLQINCGDTYSGAILQLAASSMHSDTQLAENKPEKPNDYIVDELVAESWKYKGFYQNELAKYREALTDAEATVFPNEEEKNLAIGSIYEHLAHAVEREHKYIDEIAFEKAAVMVGVDWDEHYICYAFYQLKRYTEAVKTCTDAIRSTGNPIAPYWRALAYRDSGKPGRALRDLTQVADSDGYFAASAAIDMSMIYFKRHDDRGALNVLNKYTFLYDPNRTSRSDVAVGYNNRCYAYMQLGELKKALDDCTQSLKYGSIPDAFRKQQELVRRLGLGEHGKSF